MIYLHGFLYVREMPVRNSRMYDHDDKVEEEIYRYLCSLQTTNTIIYEVRKSLTVSSCDSSATQTKSKHNNSGFSFLILTIWKKGILLLRSS